MEGQLKRYDCGYCQHTFEQVVRKSLGGKKTIVSDQVKCPRCGNFLKTWDEGEVIQVLKKRIQNPVVDNTTTDLASSGGV